MQDQFTTVTMTAACEVLGRHAGQGRGACSGRVFSFTDAHLTDCQCGCHDPAPVDPDEELERLLDEEADRRLDGVVF